MKENGFYFKRKYLYTAKIRKNFRFVKMDM